MRGFGPTPYLLLPGTAQQALDFYATVFGGAVETHTFAEFGRTDGPASAVAHGVLTGTVSLYAADVAVGEPSYGSTGLLMALLGTGDPDQSQQWFERLRDDGVVIDELQERGWNAWDGQVRDRFGVTWLIGYELQ